MADKSSALPGVIVVNASRLLTLWVCGAVVATAAASVYYLPLEVAALVGVVALISGASALRVHALRSHANAVVALRCGVGHLSCQLKSGRWIVGSVLPGGLISSSLTVVRVCDETDRRGRSVVLAPDAIAEADYRRLRVFLLWSRVR